MRFALSALVAAVLVCSCASVAGGTTATLVLARSSVSVVVSRRLDRGVDGVARLLGVVWHPEWVGGPLVTR